eukprot:3982554-Pyramimonas_sp.AAC.1
MPGEFLNARRSDLSLPRDRLESRGDAFQSIAAPQTRGPRPAQLHAHSSDRATGKIMAPAFRQLGATDPPTT